jgi:flavorubredoxin
MKARKISEGVFWLGAVDWERRLFDALIPLPEGTSYNAYLIQGSEKTVLLDSVDPTMSESLLTPLSEFPRIDYIVSHHAEQDHSGTIPAVLDRYPEAQVLCTPQAKTMLFDLLRIPESRISTVEDGAEISLGDKQLKFIYTPWVHWPETMSTWLASEGILFSCDFFGSHLATTELFASDTPKVLQAAKRYYAEIMMPFRTTIRKNLDKLAAYPIKMIAPSHGPMYPDPQVILSAYREWIEGNPRNVVVIPYISMHGSTRKMVDYLVSALVEREISVQKFDLVVTDLGALAIALVDAATIVLGSPTVHGGPHPAVFYASHLANALRPKLKFASIIGSFGWRSKAVEEISQLIPNLKVELLEPVLCKGFPGDDTLRALDRLADAILEKHRAAGL